MCVCGVGDGGRLVEMKRGVAPQLNNGVTRRHLDGA